MVKGEESMPVVWIPMHLLKEQLKQINISTEELIFHLQSLGCDIEFVTTVKRFVCKCCGGLIESSSEGESPTQCEFCGREFTCDKEVDCLGSVEVIKMELLPVRPDLFDPGGLSRALKAYLGLERGVKVYEATAGNITVVVKPEVKKVRPFIVGGVVRGVEFSYDTIRMIMKLQENIHWALGRDRKFLSIGIYDLDKIKTNKIYYSTVGSDFVFVPLGWSKSGTIAEILNSHPKGIGFRHLLGGAELYPLLYDDSGTVLSFPPIINSEDTKVTLDTHNLFIDVTGTQPELITKALNIMVTSLKELFPQSIIEKVRIVEGEGEEKLTPSLEVEEKNLSIEYTRRLLGTDFDLIQIKELLERMGYGVEFTDNKGVVKVYIPCYRTDIMHEVDIIEDIAIAYGYNNFEPSMISTFTIGVPLEKEEKSNIVRNIMVGLGFLEIINLPLTDMERGFTNLLPEDKIVIIENPITVTETVVRPFLIGGLLDTLSRNIHNPLPQKIFEIGDVTLVNEESETRAKEFRHLAIAICDDKIGFADIRSVIQALFREINIEFELVPTEIDLFIKGRGGEVYVKKGLEKVKSGFIGELHPEYIEKFNIRHPVVIAEINLSSVLDFD